MSHNGHDRVAREYFLSYLQGYISCSKRDCPGKLIPVLIQYQQTTDRGTTLSIEEELECCHCGKTAKGEALLHKLKQGETIYRDPLTPRSKLPKVGNVRGQRGKDRKRKKRLRKKQLKNFAKKRKRRQEKEY
jgi:hypothetical protein